LGFKENSVCLAFIRTAADEIKITISFQILSKQNKLACGN
jgi:hypothetical protein